MANARLYQQYVEALTTGVGDARLYQQYVEMLASATAEARLEQQYIEVLSAVTGGATIDEEADNTLTLTHDADVTVRRDFLVEHTLTLTHQANKVTDVEAENTLTLVGTASYVKFINVSSDLSVTLTHSVEVEKDIVRAINQGLALNQQATRNIFKVCEVNQPLVLSHTAVGVNTKKATSVLTLTQDAVFNLGKKAQNTLELTQTAETEVTYNRSAHTVLIPFQVASASLTITKIVNQTLTLTQSAIGHLVKPIHHVLNLTQTVEVVNAKAASSFLDLDQSATVNRSFTKTISSALNLSQSVLASKTYAVSATSILGFNQHAVGNKHVDLEVNSTLVLTQELVQRYLDEEVNDNLILTHDVDLSTQFNRTITHELSLAQSATVSISYSRSVEHTLVFKNSHEKYTGLPDHPFIDVPNLQVVKISGKCLTILQSNAQVIILPCPEFGDTEAGTSSINVKKSMSNVRYTYKRSSPTNSLTYLFILDKMKAEELRLFLLANNSNILRLQNFKGEIWSVVLTNNPFSFSEDGYWQQPRGNKVTITLEFEGVRLN